MCVTRYQFAICRRIGPEANHVYVMHRHPRSNWNDPTCSCFRTYYVWSRRLPCPLCIKQILLRVELQQRLLEETPPGIDVELDYRKCPVFYDTDDPDGNVSSDSAKKKQALTQEHRKRRNALVGEIECPKKGVGGSDEPDTLPNLEQLAINQETASLPAGDT
ncbi:hypothetical protein TWF281_006717 [Arthrobotrys megalospora]